MTPLAADYFEARSRFLAAAGRAALRVETHWHPAATAPNGAPLAIDVARAGREDATHVLFTVCGTHGVEGYPGSAAQVDLLESSSLAHLPDHVAVVLLHGLNPYGWSRDSQRNEDGIDINRNFVDFAKLPEADRELVDRFARLLDVGKLSYFALGKAMQELFAIRDEVGGKRFMQALGAGQYIEPKGIKYGGATPSWSNRVYRDVVRRNLSRATHVAELDWHAGLGAYGGTFPLFLGRHGSDEFQATCDWWGREAVERGMKSWSSDDEDAPAPDCSGAAHAGLVAEVPHARVAGGVVEFGTVPVSQIPLVVFLDHALLHLAPEEGEVAYWRAQMRTFMAPREPSWERSVLAHARRLNERTLEGLAHWGRR